MSTAGPSTECTEIPWELGERTPGKRCPSQEWGALARRNDIGMHKGKRRKSVPGTLGKSTKARWEKEQEHLET